MPTFDDVNELTTSGALPERRAAMILSSLIEPTTWTSTPAVLLSYYATISLTSLCPSALHATHTVSFVADVFELAAPTVPATVPSATTATRKTTVATRLMEPPRGCGARAPPRCRVCRHQLVNFTNAILER